ncbi:MAG: 1-deoxy-D-xylulose-5-phosphate reductoisomerase [Firmicutes bacterium]|nr:1-deoxy-D-xylulose-5-phosphate reductoisomerase [Bacillota bacterium]
MKKLAIIGSTGSIGRQTLEVAEHLREKIVIYGLAAHSSVELLAEQVKKYRPQIVVLADSANRQVFASLLGDWQGRLLTGPEGLEELATDPEVEMVVSAAVGAAGIRPTLAAVKAGKAVALANKETLVAAGELIMAAVAKGNTPFLPVDSEHSAVFQCLMGEDRSAVKNIYLTASGGPFRETGLAELEKVTPEEALAHPTWRMGKKITIDSATLMNKGLEVIEAHWLFALPYDRIQVVIHPQSIVHAVVEMVDGFCTAQLGPADMRLPIQFALTYPERRENPFSHLDLPTLGRLDFSPPDLERFPCLALAYAAGRRGGTMPAVMNAANEEAVAAFLGGRIGFSAIPALVEKVMEEHEKAGFISSPDLETILDADNRAREVFSSFLTRHSYAR